MDAKLRNYVIIGGAVAAAAIIIGVVALAGVFDSNKMSTPKITEKPQTTLDSQNDIVTSQEPQLDLSNENANVQTGLQPYRINTSCELLYAMSASVYPNNERLQSLSIIGVVSKYPDDFKPWLATFADANKTRAFIQEGFSPEFLDIFANKVMQEYTINPELKPLVLMALDPKSQSTDVNKIFEADKCIDYFVSRKGTQTTQP